MGKQLLAIERSWESITIDSSMVDCTSQDGLYMLENVVDIILINHLRIIVVVSEENSTANLVLPGEGKR